MTDVPLFDLRDVSFAYAGADESLRAVSLRVMRGEHLALLGPNGAGKSTLLLLLGGLLYATRGAVRFEGRVLDHLAVEHDSAFRCTFRQRVGVLFQNPDAQLFCPTVREEVAFGPLQALGREEALARTAETMRLLDIDRLAAEAPYALSGGEKRRVALASVLAMRPEILLLDEPMAGLDPATCRVVAGVLDDYAADPGKTVVVATHDLDAARALATTCAVLASDHGIVMHGEADTVLDNEELLRQVNLLGDPLPRRSARQRAARP